MNRYSSILCLSLLFFYAPLLKAESVVDTGNKEIMDINKSATANNSDAAPDSTRPALNQQGVIKQAVKDDSGRWLLHAEEWELTRTGESILSLPVLKSVIKAWLQDQTKKIEIQYPGGEEGEFWVHELADWMVSLAIPSDHIVFVAGSGAADVIKFQLIKL